MYKILKSTFNKSPDGTEELIFEFTNVFVKLITDLPLLRQIKCAVLHLITGILKCISPAMNLNILPDGNSPKGTGLYAQIFLFAFPLTCFFCLGLNAILSWQSGTLLPASAINQINLLSDWHNIFLYALICPLYVSCAICLIVTTLLHWKTLNRFSSDAAKGNRSFRPKAALRLSMFFAICFLITSLFIANYINDLRNSDITKELYWFFDEAVSGERILNAAGSYYLFLNAVLLFITSLAAFCYITMSIEAIRLGHNIHKSDFAVIDTSKPRRDQLFASDQRLLTELSNFSHCYIWAKALLLVYAVNIIVWQISPAGQVANVHAAIFAVIIIGVFFIAIPRLYLGSRWHHFKLDYLTENTEEANSDVDKFEYTDIRSTGIKKTSIILNLVYGIIFAAVLGRQYGAGDLAGIILMVISQS